MYMHQDPGLPSPASLSAARSHRAPRHRARPYTSFALVSNASTIFSATLGSTAWDAMRCSGFANANTRSMLRIVLCGPAGVKLHVVTRFLNSGVVSDAVAWG